jgi:DNA polymerase III subunit beta
MELKIEKGTLLGGLYLAQGIADRKSTMPILANVLLRTEGRERLLVAATDLNVTVTAELPAKITTEGGITLGARHLHEIVRALPGDTVSLRRADNAYAELRAGKVEYKVVGMPDRDFPKLPNHREVEFHSIPAAALVDLIDKTFFSVSTDETRYHLNGVLFDCDGAGENAHARMVSTDGHRLSKAERALPGGPKAAAVIIPRKGLAEIRRALEGATGQVELGFHRGHVFVRVGMTAISIKLIEAQFPPFEQVIPKESERKVPVDRLALLEGLKRISIMSSDKTQGVKVALEQGTLRISSDNPDLGEAREELEVKFDQSPVTIGFNARYLIDLLSQMGTEKVRLELNGELDPGVLRPVDGDDYLGVVMPMRI